MSFCWSEQHVSNKEKRFKPTAWQLRKQRVRPILVFSTLNDHLSHPFQVAFIAKEADGISLHMIENQWSFENRMRWNGALKMPVYPPDASNLIYCQC